MRLAAAWLLAWVWIATCQPAMAGNPQAQGRIEVTFTPGDDAAGRIISSIQQARQQVLVQAYSFTHKGIGDALVAAKERGLDVRVVADHDQTYDIATSIVADLARRGVPVWLDSEHAAAHNKVMIIDPGHASATVITGSYNFTHAAQYRNAENLIILRDNADLACAYAENWHRHRQHARPLRPAGLR